VVRIHGSRARLALHRIGLTHVIAEATCGHIGLALPD
jgi:hypothetical protein